MQYMILKLVKNWAKIPLLRIDIKLLKKMLKKKRYATTLAPFFLTSVS